jgi:acyl carrier protein
MPTPSTQAAIEQKLIEIFRISLQLEMSDAEIRSIIRANNPKWDSMTHLNLILASEEAFQVSIPDDQSAGITSFANLLEVIQKLRS